MIAPIPELAQKAEVVTICGSSKFKTEILEEVARLTLERKLVISLGVFGHHDMPGYNWDTDASDLKTMLDALHRQKIDMADSVHVVNPGGYYGESTAREIDYALELGKPITFMTTPVVAPGTWPCLTCGGAIRRRVHAPLGEAHYEHVEPGLSHFAVRGNELEKTHEEGSVPETPTDSAVEYGFYDSEYGPDPVIWYCFNLPFTTIAAALHTAQKSVFGQPVIVRRPAGATDPAKYELVDEKEVADA